MLTVRVSFLVPTELSFSVFSIFSFFPKIVHVLSRQGNKYFEEKKDVPPS